MMRQAHLRIDASLADEILKRVLSGTTAFFEETVVCPHEEGIDYERPTCPRRPYWA
jgi:hypothetical protein